MAAKPGVKPKLQETSRLTRRREDTVMDLIINFSCDEAGASAVEYAFLLAFIAVAITASIVSLSSAVANLFNSVPWPN